MGTALATSTASTASAYGNQRKLDRCQNGVLWAITATTPYTLRTAYSLDDGATWVIDTATLAGVVGGGNIPSNNPAIYTINGSFFIDQDDYAHAVVKSSDNGFIYYTRGTPTDASRTAWTWSAATLLRSDALCDYPDVVAHQEGTGWAAHVVYSYKGTPATYAYYEKVEITSGGVITNPTVDTLSANHATAAHTYPSIDFNHTGDGKTVAGGTPHLYVGWSAGTTGAGKGVRFRKASYSAGVWTWGTEREIDSTRYVDGTNWRWLNCLFDGTRVILAGCLNTATTAVDVMLYERDAADSATVTRGLLVGLSGGSADVLYSGSATYDSAGNVYLLGRGHTGSSGTRSINRRKWTRATTALGAIGTIDATGNDNPYISAKRGYSDNRIEWIYTDGTASPYTVTYDALSLFTAATIKWWTGGQWVEKPLKRWDGTAWQTVEASKFKRWNGTAWVPA